MHTYVCDTQMCGQRRSCPRSSDRPILNYVYNENPAQEPPQKEVIKNYGLSTSARVLARRAPEAEIQARSHQNRDSSEINDFTTFVVMPSAAGTENQRFWYDFYNVIENCKQHEKPINETTKNTVLFWHSFYKCFHDFWANGSAQRCPTRTPSDVDNDFATIFAIVNFRINRLVASFVLRCQEALHGTSTFKSKKKLQQQKAGSRAGRNRRRVSSTF